MRMALIMAATAAYAQDDIFGCSSPNIKWCEENGI